MDRGLGDFAAGEAGEVRDGEDREGEAAPRGDFLEREWVGLAGSPGTFNRADTPLSWQWLGKGQNDPLARP